MILHRETYKKFGYWPRDLTTESTKKVLCVCVSCEQIRLVQYRCVRKKTYTKRCQNCSRKANAPKAAAFHTQFQKEKRHRLWDTTVPAKITPDFALELFTSYQMCQVSAAFRRNKWPLLRSRVTNLKSEVRPSQKETISIIKGLGFVTHPLNTEQFKNGVIGFIRKLPSLERLYVINKILSTKHTRARSGGLEVALKFDKWKDIFQMDGIEFESVNIKYPTMKITKGSFFIDGRWIHVG